MTKETDDLDKFFVETNKIGDKFNIVQSNVNTDLPIHNGVSSLVELTKKYSKVISDPSTTNTDKVLLSTDTKLTTVSIRNNINELYHEIDSSKQEFDEFKQYLNKLIEEGEQLLLGNNADFERLKDKIQSNYEEELDPYRKQVLIDRQEIISDAIIKLKTQLLQINTLDMTLQNSYNKIDFLANKYLPMSILQINTNNLLLKFDLIEEIDNIKLLDLDMNSLLETLKSDKSSNLPDTSNPEEYFISLIRNQSLALRSSLEKVLELSNRTTYIGRSVIISDINRLLGQIDKL